MEKKPVMKLIGYEINKLELNRNESYDPGTEAKIDITPSFTFEFQQAEDTDSIYKVKIKCSLFQDAERNNYPFSCIVQVSGIFEIIDIANKDTLLKYNAVAILLPYLRALVSQITTLAEFPTLRLPILNVYELQEKAKINQDNDT